jgi:hypothetical protein
VGVKGEGTAAKKHVRLEAGPSGKGAWLSMICTSVLLL